MRRAYLPVIGGMERNPRAPAFAATSLRELQGRTCRAEIEEGEERERESSERMDQRAHCCQKFWKMMEIVSEIEKWSPVYELEGSFAESRTRSVSRMWQSSPRAAETWSEVRRPRSPKK